MAPTSRREFLFDSVGRGMLVAGLGAALVHELGFSTAFADEGPDELRLGEYGALVDLLQSTPAEKLQPVLVKMLEAGGTDLRTLIAAAALANAETFGGQDYVGFHAAMAFLPAWNMASFLPAERRPLPILKVLYRNTDQIQKQGGASKKTLRALRAAEHAAESDVGSKIRDAARKGDMDGAERRFSSLAKAPLEDAFNALQPVVQDDVDVHRFVFAHRVYGLARFLGKEHAYDLLRQCVRYCADNERGRISRNSAEPPIRTLLPKLLDEKKLAGRALGKRDPGDAWVDETSRAIYLGPPARAAEAVAAALAEGIDPEVVGEAISLASNRLVLGQGKGRTHGASSGVHSSDATNAWRNMARVAEPRFAISGLIVAAYHSAAHDPFTSDPCPTADQLAGVKATTPEALLDEAANAVRANDQGRAAAAIAIYDERGFPAEKVLERMLSFTVSEDGRLHGEKYFQTVQEEYRTIRPAFRGRQLVGLARVTASAYGYDVSDRPGFRAPGYEEACRLLGVEA